jgi:hypothetical protein
MQFHFSAARNELGDEKKGNRRNHGQNQGNSGLGWSGNKGTINEFLG